jgi:isochorismate hydrolase
MQDSVLAPIAAKESVVFRACYLIEIARLLEVPIIVTEQYANGMGATNQRVLDVLPKDLARHDKLCFSSCRLEAFQDAWHAADRSQAVLIGTETHICVTQTAHDFLANDIEVLVCADAVGARPPDAHDIALKRLRHAGAIVAHTESIAYEWLQAAGTDEFRRSLEITKRYAG